MDADSPRCLAYHPDRVTNREFLNRLITIITRDYDRAKLSFSFFFYFRHSLLIIKILDRFDIHDLLNATKVRPSRASTPYLKNSSYVMYALQNQFPVPFPGIVPGRRAGKIGNN